MDTDHCSGKPFIFFSLRITVIRLLENNYIFTKSFVLKKAFEINVNNRKSKIKLHNFRITVSGVDEMYLRYLLSSIDLLIKLFRSVMSLGMKDKWIKCSAISS